MRFDVIMIQEHKLDQTGVHSAAKSCFTAGWHGIWAAAETSSSHHLGRSGGVAILAPRHVVITQGPEQHGHRHIHGMIQWTQRKMRRLFSLYAYDVSYPYPGRVEPSASLFNEVQGVLAQMGKVPWILGADFNQEPAETLVGW